MKDSMSQRVSDAFDTFIEVRKQSDQDLARLSRELEIDIVIDLGGLTSGNRPGIFSYRAAPIQVSYIGYGGTMAAEYYDYLIADKTIIPPASQIHYSERIAYLPSHQTSSLYRAATEKTFTREDLGLPSSGFVFCCFNNNVKITPSTFGGWMRILKEVEGSVLFLNVGNASAISNLKKEAAKRGVNPSRVIFKKFLPRADHLATYRIADLFLDIIFPYNAGTTASDALRAELPILTLMGEYFVSRLAGSVLNALRLPELMTHTQDRV